MQSKANITMHIYIYARNLKYNWIQIYNPKLKFLKGTKIFHLNYQSAKVRIPATNFLLLKMLFKKHICVHTCKAHFSILKRKKSDTRKITQAKMTITKRLKYCLTSFCFLVFFFCYFKKYFKVTEKNILTVNQLTAYPEFCKLASKHILMTYHNSRFKVPQLHKIWHTLNTQIFLQVTLTSSVMLYFYLFSQVIISCLSFATLNHAAVPSEPCPTLLRPLLQNLRNTFNCMSALHCANSPVPNKAHFLFIPSVRF